MSDVARRVSVDGRPATRLVLEREPLPASLSNSTPTLVRPVDPRRVAATSAPDRKLLVADPEIRSSELAAPLPTRDAVRLPPRTTGDPGSGVNTENCGDRLYDDGCVPPETKAMFCG